VVFSPNEEIITKGPPKERRLFFDRVFSICSAKYLDLLLSYNRTIKQRNTILKNKRKETEKELNIWNQPLSLVGQALWIKRSVLVKEFSREFNAIVKKLDKELKLKITYKEKKGTEKEFLDKTQKNTNLDLKNGFTSYGPHKDDMVFLWKDKTIRKHGSQGEHKLFLAVLKITELVFMLNKTKRLPIFLIDDLFSSLDKEKSKKLLRFVETFQAGKKTPPQTIITTTDLLDLEQNGFFPGFNNIKKHHLKK
jgi:DNA replication and repair protein RecF